MIAILVLLAQLAAIKTLPTPAWKTFPVDHWTCPDGFYADSLPEPTCRPYTPLLRKMSGAGAGQERIHWGQVEMMPKSGHLRIVFWPGFIGQPGCRVDDKTDEKMNQVWFSDVSKEGFTMKAPPGHKLHLNCQGVMKLEDERER